ncbi:MAG: hypothetical protein O3C40_07510 [Planctomycetota bacterium]|nr:hypothetical protein [Planctomycetota bacterium]
MQPFHIVIRAIPNRELPTQSITFAGRDIDALIVPPALQATPLGVSFEQAADALATFPRMHVEPDGSFVWVSSSEDEEAWQVDGNLYDRDGSLIAIDLKGTCDQTKVVLLLDVFRAAGRELMIEVVRDATFIRERDFLESLPKL